MATEECYFGMFSDEGNRRVKDLVDIAIRDSKDWDWIVRELEALPTGKDRRKFSYAEATDTAVRMSVV